MSAVRVAVTGWSVHLPGLPSTVDLLDGLGGLGGPASLDDRMRKCLAGLVEPPACTADRASTLLGRKGLLYKEPATRLALCAVHRALGLPAGRHEPPTVDPRVAVVACGNLGNAETVVRTAHAARTEGVRAVSPLDAPNASSNVIASTVALWFGFGGPNLMVCSGATAGLDGLALAVRLLRADRADRVVLVGAEPDDPVASALHAGSGSGAPLRGGAACVLLERAPDGTLESMLVDDTRGAEPAEVAIGPDTGAPARVDPIDLWGDTYGAAGVLGVACAAALVAGGAASAVRVRCGSAEDGWRDVRVCEVAL